jgi:dienelactone hydrolase
MMGGMTEIILYHHAQGLTDGVRAFGETLRDAGHTVHVPDMYRGNVFGTLEEGLAYAGEAGFGAVAQRGLAAAEDLPEEVVYIGFSLGVMPAQELAQTKPGARGAQLAGSCIPASEWGGWPAGVPVQIHGMDADAIFVGEGDLDAAKALVAGADDAELFLYPGTQHLFFDNSLPAYDADQAAVFTQRVLAFCDRVSARA